MGHRKVHSQGSIPFSWEDKPGISKFTHLECPIDITSPPPPPPPPPPCPAGIRVKIPPPPCPYKPARRSTSTKDPFLVAYKECTKSGVTYGKLPSESKKGVGSKARKKRQIFSCKNSCEVRDDNLVRLPNLPSLPRDHRVGELKKEPLAKQEYNFFT